VLISTGRGLADNVIGDGRGEADDCEDREPGSGIGTSVRIYAGRGPRVLEAGGSVMYLGLDLR
jgi:hypothetical protein